MQDNEMKHDKVYNSGLNAGFFAAFLLFASMFYFLMDFLNKLPKPIKYYHIVIFVIVAYFAGLIILKFRKQNSFS